MACLIECSACKKTLKEEGDEMKDSAAEYRVYDNLSNSKHDGGTFRLIMCLSCNHVMDQEEFGVPRDLSGVI
jgi:hypothetical protein